MAGCHLQQIRILNWNHADHISLQFVGVAICLRYMEKTAM